VSFRFFSFHKNQSNTHEWLAKQPKRKGLFKPSLFFQYVGCLELELKRADSCACRGSPTPSRRKPSKLIKPGVVSEFTLFFVVE